MAKAKQLVKRAKRLEKRIERRGAAGKQTAGAEKKLTRVSGKLSDKTGQIAGRIAAGTAPRPGQAQKRLGKVVEAGRGASAALAGTDTFQPRQASPGDLEAQQAAASAPLATVTPGGQAIPPPGQAPPQVGPPPTTPAVPEAPPNFTDVLANQFGAGNPFAPGSQASIQDIATQGSQAGSPFAPSDLFGNPLQTAQDAAQRFADQQLAGIRQQFAGQGLGNSSRSALTQGAALGQIGTNLGDILAQRGLQQRSADLNRLAATSGQQAGLNQQAANTSLQAILGAGEQQLAGQQLGLQATQQQFNQGQAISALQQAETQVPGLSAFLQALGLFPAGSSQQTTTGGTSATTGVFI